MGSGRAMTRRWIGRVLPMLSLAAAVGAHAQEAVTIRTYAAQEARQGVASDGAYFYAIDNNRIGKYRIATGERVQQWEGDPESFPHINSCTVAEEELVCASSNYPALPQKSSVEFFSLNPVAHLRSVSLAGAPGSLTVMNRHDGHWWAVFANYDKRGSEPGQDHRQTYLVRYDDDFHALAQWTFPADVLARFAPSSCSGASWTTSGLLLASGHDRPEIYALKLPKRGTVLEHVATLPVASHGQAIDMDPKWSDLLWSIDRPTSTVVASRVDITGQAPGTDSVTSGRADRP